MDYLFTASSILNNITENKESFSLAINNACKKHIVGDNRRLLTTIVGCALRHYIILKYRLSSVEGIETKQINASILVISNILFAKKISDNESFEFLKKSIDNDDIFNKVKELTDKFINGEALIPEECNQNSLEYLSFRYNTPLWVVKMWRKHYGYKIMRNILISNSRHFNNYARVNPEYIDEERFAIENPTFEKTKFDHFYLFNEKCPVKKALPYLNKQIAVYPIAMDEIISESDADSFRGIAAYCSTPNSLLSALCANLTSYVELDMVVGKQQAYFECKQEKEHFNLKNAHLYEGQPESIVTCVSKEVHTMFVIPDSSKFFMLRNTPDYFIRFEQNSLDELISGQKLALQESAKFVEQDGYLVYIVPTLSQKENQGIINDFLANNDSYIFVKDKVIFPFTGYDTSMYYAILRRIK